MDVSVIVPTFNRAASLNGLLDALRHQTGDVAFEVLIVDNRSSDETWQAVRRHADVDDRVRYLFERRRGPSSARNCGIAAAAAPILAFIDDDIRPREDWVASIVAAFRAHPEVDCIGGRVEPRWPSAPPKWLTRAQWSPLALQVGRHSGYLDREHGSACLITANFACRARVFCELGGFSRDFLRDEDREFNLRMWRAGKRGLYVDSVVAYADVQAERLERRYHRAWYHTTGASHARMRYRDVIDRDGRLDDGLAARGRVWWGVPGFLYRECVMEAIAWSRNLLVEGYDAAFFHECRLRYFGSYFVTRWRERLAARVAPPTSGASWRNAEIAKVQMHRAR
jgi:glycosyltransferase involved in cell wall biosynthesis